MEILTIIPARGGSKRVKRKNLLPVAGKPLVLHSVDAVIDANKLLGADATLRPVVSTDSAAIRDLVDARVEVAQRRKVNARDEATIADVVFEVVDQYEWSGPVMVIQPTSILHPKSIESAVKFWMRDPSRYVASTSPCEGFHWGLDEDENDTPEFRERVNSQYQADFMLIENGAVRIYPAGEGDYARNPDKLYGIDCVDIDTWGDLQQVRSQHSSGRVVFSVTANDQTGSGHLYRCLALADELQGHNVAFEDSNLMSDWAAEMVVDCGYRLYVHSEAPNGEPAVWVNDRLDTGRQHIADLVSRGWKVMNLEDRGPGALSADLVINAMYPGSARMEVNGPDWAVIRPEFLAKKWEYLPDGNRVMVMFGGVDPKDLTFQTVQALKNSGHDLRVMTGPGYRGGYEGPTYQGSVSSAMLGSDLLVTSGGRTVFEAAALGIPALVIAQNLREVSHTHVGEEAGNVYLGLADVVTKGQIFDAVNGLMLFPEPRIEMSKRSKSLVDGKGVRRIVRLIEDLLEGL